MKNLKSNSENKNNTNISIFAISNTTTINIYEFKITFVFATIKFNVQNFLLKSVEHVFIHYCFLFQTLFFEKIRQQENKNEKLSIVYLIFNLYCEKIELFQLNYVRLKEMLQFIEKKILISINSYKIFFLN